MTAARMVSFDIQRFQIEFLAAPNARTCAATVGADDLPLVGAILGGAGHALQLCGDMPEMQLRALRYSSLGDLAPIELDRVIGVRGHLAHCNVGIGDALGVLLARFLQSAVGD